MAEVDVYKPYIEHPEDWSYVRGFVYHAPSHVLPALFCAYLSTWRDAAMREPSPVKRENAGRRAANRRIRLDSNAMQKGDKKVAERYQRLVQKGPKQACATCQHCNMKGECKEGLPGPGDLCEEWKADFV